MIRVPFARSVGRAPVATASTRPDLRRLAWWADASAVLALAVGQVAGFLPSYGPGWIWVCVLGGTLVGAGLAEVSRRRRWSPARTLGVGVLAWFVVGGPLAMPQATLGFLLPTARSLRGLLVGPVSGWRDMLTVAAPLGTTSHLMTIPLLMAMTTGLASWTLARRSRTPAMAWAPGVLGMLIAAGLGTHRVVLPLVTALASVAVVLVWTAAQRGRARTTLVRTVSTRRLPRAVSGALVLAVAAGVTIAASGPIHPTADRRVLRDVVVAPLDVQAWASPLQGFRANISQHLDTVLFRVDGVDEGTFVRLANLENYDGLTYDVASFDEAGRPLFSRIGARIEDPTVGAEHPVTVTVVDDLGVWVPTVGATRDITFAGPRRIDLDDSFFHSVSAQTSVDTLGLVAGDSYQLDVVIPEIPSAAQIDAANAGQHWQAQLPLMPDRVRELATTWTIGATSAGQAARMLADRLSQTGWYSHGVQPTETVSLPGHSLARITELLADENAMIGDDEQYSVAMALLCRQLGMASRVTYGYQVGTGGRVTGADVRAFTEVYLEQLGWVSFDPTPATDRILKEYDPTTSTQTRPHVDNPPPAPDRPDLNPPDDQSRTDQPDSDDRTRRFDLGLWLGRIAVVGLPMIVLLGPIVLILGLKSRRRRSRMHAPRMSDRVSGGWAELLDVARDLGDAVSPAATRSEQAASLTATHPVLGQEADAMQLARQADVATFAPEPVSEEQAGRYWTGVDRAVAALWSGMRRRRVWLARMSTRSFRRFR